MGMATNIGQCWPKYPFAISIPETERTAKIPGLDAIKMRTKQQQAKRQTNRLKKK
jgi:hypothetical protein